MELLLRLTGFILMTLGLFHVFFPKYFKWKEEFSKVSTINRQMMYVHSFFIAFVVLLMGLLCVTSAADLLTTPLGKRICLGISIFLDDQIIHPVFWLLFIPVEGENIRDMHPHFVFHPVDRSECGIYVRLFSIIQSELILFKMHLRFKIPSNHDVRNA